jgi:hypothetical protein
MWKIIVLVCSAGMARDDVETALDLIHPPITPAAIHAYGGVTIGCAPSCMASDMEPEEVHRLFRKKV